ncbi:hypothetical protein ACSBR1_036407 [Camellia fascicularis]
MLVDLDWTNPNPVEPRINPNPIRGFGLGLRSERRVWFGASNPTSVPRERERERENKNTGLPAASPSHGYSFPEISRVFHGELSNASFTANRMCSCGG